ncbi:MAG: ADP-glyceromanno-heptose 6-epimerase [Ignavibacteria bacterium]|nr:ADP-glyceromanno-heptose 6-epimerase [Ignavibacteria bacterium]
MIAVTGAAGFIGSCFVRTLNEQGYNDILIIDSLEQDDRWNNLVTKKFRGIEHPEVFKRKCSEGIYDAHDISALIHMGACSSTTERNAEYLLENNYRYSIAMAQFALAHDIPFIYASSAATYGAGEKGYDDASVSELRPLNMYGYSKQLFDEWIMGNGLEQSITGIKFFNVFGPNEYHKGDMASMIFKSWKQVQHNGHISLFASDIPEYPDGGQMRDFIYVKDACEVMWKILQSKQSHGIINLGTGKARTWNDLAHAVFKALGKQSDIRYVSMPDSLKGQYQYYTQAVMDKLQSSSSAHQFLELEDSIADYVVNHLEQTTTRYY